MADVVDRVMARAIADGDCVVWQGAKSAEGYGYIKVSGRLRLVHREVFAAHYGPILDGLVVDHKCRNRSCVKPEHLQQVTRKENNENKGVRPGGTSAYRGVHFDSRTRDWHASVGHAGRKYFAGAFSSEAEAAEAARLLRLRLHTNNLDDRKD